MPLVVYSLGAYVVGLYAGFSASPPLALMSMLAAFGVGWVRGRAVAAGFALLTLAGIVIARSDSRAEERCAKITEDSDSILVVIADSIGPGGFSRGHLSNCGTPIAISVAHGSADAGATVVARGSVLRSQRGLLMQGASISIVSTPALLPRMRAAAGRAIDRTFR